MDLKVLGAEIKKIRQSQKLTQKELGELIGKTESSVQKYESGATEIPMSVLGNIAEALGTDIIDFVDTRSAIDLMNSRDIAFDKYLKALGFEITVSDNDPNHQDYVIYNGYKYEIPTMEVFYVLENCKEYSLFSMEKLLEKYSDNRIRV